MDASQRQEQAALVAQLRATTATWPDVTADVLEAGSALAVWRDRQSFPRKPISLRRPHHGSFSARRKSKKSLRVTRVISQD